MMGLEDVTLSETSRSQKDKPCAVGPTLWRSPVGERGACSEGTWLQPGTTGSWSPTAVPVV